MSFTSVAFLCLVGLSVLAYYLAPGKYRWAVLLAASYVFYLTGGVRMVGYLLFTTMTTYLAGLCLGRLNARFASASGNEKDTIRARAKRSKRLVSAAAIVISFGLLYMLKYWDFTVLGIGKFVPGASALALDLVVPLGVSFYIFQSVGYVIDVYRAKIEPEKNPAKFALFVSFFPQVVQGPISRFDQLAPQLTQGHKLDFKNLKFGIQLAMWGYFKKLVIAGRAGVLVDRVFSAGTEQSGAMIAVGVIFYCIQLYCDFSGGIDITRGVAKLFGIDMIENFRRPIFAVSLVDFWRRWHISLSAWLKDYLFYPLSLSKPFGRLGKFARRHFRGKLGKIFATSLATFIVYFVIGIWHGANFRYIAFGVWNGAIITGSLLLNDFYAGTRKSLHIKDGGAGMRVFRILRTAFIVFLGRYITRAPRFLTGVAMAWTTFTKFQPGRLIDGTVFTLGLTQWNFAVVMMGIAIVLCVEWYQERGGKVREMLERKSFFVQWMAILVPLIIIILLGAINQDYVAAEFIYAQF